MEWQDSYNVGVPIIDDAHRKLFSIVRKLAGILEDEDHGKSKRACIEGIKYFKSYALEHFAQEEAYMKSINYEGYPAHKQIHDNLRDVTIPQLERELERENYSDEAVAHCIGTFVGWLTGHIMVEDQAITGKLESRVRHRKEADDVISKLEEVIAQVVQELFNLEPKLASKYYRGDNLGPHLACRISCRTTENKAMDVTMFFEEGFMFHAVGGMLGVEFHKVNDVIISAMEELIHMLVQRMSGHFQDMNKLYCQREISLLDPARTRGFFDEQMPQYSLLFDTGYGYFVFCVYREGGYGLTGPSAPDDH